MLIQQTKEQEFLDRFTEEIILNIKLELDKRNSLSSEEARKRREEEIRRLKERFAREVESIQPRLPIEIQKPQFREQPRIMIPPQKIVPVQFAPPKMQPQQVKPIAVAKKPVQPIPSNIEAPKTLLPVGVGEIDFAKIILLIRDPLITYIEAPGDDKNVIIRKAGNTYTTQIKLTKAEILSIVKSFSEVTRIPLIEGMLTARYENLEMSAVVSETISPSFIIKKDIIPVVKAPPSQLLSPSQPYVARGQMRPTAMPGQKPNLPQAPAMKMIPGQQKVSPMRPPMNVQQKPEEKKESIWNKKIKIGK